MSKSILVTRPNHDPITNYFFYWSELVIDEANKKGVKVLDLRAEKANRQNFESYIKKHQPILIFINGHGNERVLAGYNNEILISQDEFTDLLQNKIIYARSCDAGRSLGKICTENKTIAFVGYKKKYALVSSRSNLTNPLNDNVAKLFLEPSNLIPLSLLKGNKVKDAYRKSQYAMWQNFLFMLSTRATQTQRDAAPYLWANRKNQIVWGMVKQIWIPTNLWLVFQKRIFCF